MEATDALIDETTELDIYPLPTARQAAKLINELSLYHLAECEHDSCDLCVAFPVIAKVPTRQPIEDHNFIPFFNAANPDNLYYVKLNGVGLKHLYAVQVLLRHNLKVANDYPENAPVVSTTYNITYQDTIERWLWELERLIQLASENEHYLP